MSSIKNYKNIKNLLNEYIVGKRLIKKTTSVKLFEENDEFGLAFLLMTLSSPVLFIDYKKTTADPNNIDFKILRKIITLIMNTLGTAGNEFNYQFLVDLLIPLLPTDAKNLLFNYNLLSFPDNPIFKLKSNTKTTSGLSNPGDD